MQESVERQSNRDSDEWVLTGYENDVDGDVVMSGTGGCSNELLAFLSTVDIKKIREEIGIIEDSNKKSKKKKKRRNKM